MITLTFSLNKETMVFAVIGKEIFYKDRIFNPGIRLIPKDENFVRKVINSRGKYPKKLLTMFTLSKVQQEEYDFAKTEDDLAAIIINDCKKKGMQLVNKEHSDGGD